MKKPKSQDKPKRGQSVPPLVILVVLVVALFLIRNARKNGVMYTDDVTEEHILGKAVAEQILPELFPVAIYEVQDSKTNFGACGVCYTNVTSGTWRIITMSHVFFKRYKPTSFVVRKLTPCEIHPSWCIEKIVTIGKQWGTQIDLAECDLKYPTKSLPIIPCNVDVNPSRPAYTDLFTFEEVQPTGLTNVSKRTVTSLLSGEKINLCGIVPEADRSSWYYLANYKIIPGESGTCFIDNEHSLYFAEGASAFTVTPDVMKKFELTVNKPGLIFGPLRLRMQK